MGDKTLQSQIVYVSGELGLERKVLIVRLWVGPEREALSLPKILGPDP